MARLLLASILLAAVLAGCSSAPEGADNDGVGSGSSPGSTNPSPSGTTTATTTTATTSTSSSTQSGSSTTSANAAGVTIQGFTFSPQTLNVKAGTAVTFTNQGDRAHTVSSQTGAFDSGNIGAGKSWTFTFDVAGTYDYRCDIHPQMTGSVHVTA